MDVESYAGAGEFVLQMVLVPKRVPYSLMELIRYRGGCSWGMWCLLCAVLVFCCAVYASLMFSVFAAGWFPVFGCLSLFSVLLGIFPVCCCVCEVSAISEPFVIVSCWPRVLVVFLARSRCE